MSELRHPDTTARPFADAIKVGLRGRCPCCGRGKLFSAFLTIAGNCDDCGQSYSFADAGDGPAVFGIFTAGFLVVGLALWLEVNHNPPLWLHFLLWIPLTLVVTLVSLRTIKGVLIGLQFRNRAIEGRLDSPR